jgi:hypothetical protein
MYEEYMLFITTRVSVMMLGPDARAPPASPMFVVRNAGINHSIRLGELRMSILSMLELFPKSK